MDRAGSTASDSLRSVGEADRFADFVHAILTHALHAPQGYRLGGRLNYNGRLPVIRAVPDGGVNGSKFHGGFCEIVKNA